MLRYRDLASVPPTVNGRTPFLFCPECYGRYSASASDYFVVTGWFGHGDKVIRCACGTRRAMVLAVEHCTIEPVKIGGAK